MGSSAYEAKAHNLLQSIHSEPRLITLMLLEQSPRTYSEIRRKFIEEVASSWTPTHANFRYLMNIHNCTGMANNGCSRRDDSYVSEWSISDEGKEYGWSLSAFSLAQGRKYGVTNCSLFGAYGNRNVLARYNLLSALQNGPMRRIDLARRIELSPTNVVYNIRILERCGLVDYESLCLDTPRQFKYEWADGNGGAEMRRFCSSGRELRVAQALQRMRSADYLEIAEDTSIGKGNVPKFLVRLWKKGFARRRMNDFFLREKQSEARITEKGRTVLEDVYERLLKAVSDAYERSAMRDIFNSYMSDKDAFSSDARSALGQYRHESGYLKKMPSEAYEDAIMEAIVANRKVRPSDLSQIGMKYPAPFLRSLLERGVITRFRRGMHVYYRPRNALVDA